MKHDLQPYTRLFQAYTELRAIERREQRVSVFNGEVVENRSIIRNGGAARVYSHGCWGMASFSNITEDAMTQAIRDAADRAIWLGEQEPRQVLTLPARPGVDEHDLSAPQIDRRNQLHDSAPFESSNLTFFASAGGSTGWN